MPILCNLHTHSNYSDGRNTLEEMVQSAVAHGFTALGLSDHGYADFSAVGMTPAREAEYRAEVTALKARYASQIELALGYEHEYPTIDCPLHLYDYVISSIHGFYHDGEYLCVDEAEPIIAEGIRTHFGGDGYAYARAFYDALCASIEAIPGDIVGHIDLLTKFNEDKHLFDPEDPRFLAPAMDAVALAVERNRIVEINTGAMSRGYRSAPYPGPALLRRLRQLNARITISSDCHRAEWIDFAFDQAADYARSCGFTEYWIWKDGRLQPELLERRPHP